MGRTGQGAAALTATGENHGESKTENKKNEPRLWVCIRQGAQVLRAVGHLVLRP